MTENIIHRKYRILTDAFNDVWDRISFWHAAEDIELSNGTNLETDIANKNVRLNAVSMNFAPIETLQATSAHLQGEMLIYNDVLYRAKTAIAPGDTLIIGTNIEGRNVSDLSQHLVATDGVQFYFDKKDGKYGFYPNASKQPSDFIPITYGGQI